MKILHYFIIVSLCFLMGCGSSATFNPSDSMSVKLDYAKGFTVDTTADYKIITVKDPWNSSKILQKYLLISRDKELPEGIGSDYTVVRTPIEKIVCYTGVDASIIEALGSISSVVGVCEWEFIPIDKIQEGVKNGTIADLGQATMPSTEKIALLSPDAIIVSPYQNSGYGAVAKLGIPIIECAAYMENSPLGHSEWIKFLAYFLEKESEADSLFCSIKERYNTMAQIAQKAEEKPMLLAGKRYGNSWHMAAGDSYMAKIYNDAATFYPWSDSKGTGSLSLSFEAVFEAAHNADYWFILYYDPSGSMTYDKLQSEYELYSKFAPFKNRKIFGCNTLKTNYYQTAILNPDKVVGDLIKIMHPSLLPNYKLCYYQPLED